MSAVANREEVKVYKVSSDNARGIEMVLELVSTAMIRAGTHTLEQVAEGLQTRKYQGWIVVCGNSTGGLVTKVNRTPRGVQYLNVWLLGGEDFMLWGDAIIDSLKRYAREQNCARVTATVRPGLSRWLTRRFGWRKRAEVVEITP